MVSTSVSTSATKRPDGFATRPKPGHARTCFVRRPSTPRIRFDLPDFIDANNGIFSDRTYYEPDPKASWVEAGSYTITYDKLRRL